MIRVSKSAKQTSDCMLQPDTYPCLSLGIHFGIKAKGAIFYHSKAAPLYMKEKLPTPQ